MYYIKWSDTIPRGTWYCRWESWFFEPSRPDLVEAVDGQMVDLDYPIGAIGRRRDRCSQATRRPTIM